MSEIVRYDTIQDYCKLNKFTCLNDLVTVVDFTTVKEINLELMSFGFYAIIIKGEYEGKLTYGLSKYNYTDGSIIFVAPNQIFGIDGRNAKRPSPTGMALLFQPEFLEGSTVKERIMKCDFFSYETNEALNISEADRKAVVNCMNNIKEELLNPEDNHTKTVVLANVLVLLAHCRRAFDKQYSGRRQVNNELYERFNNVLHHYFENGLPEKLGLPTVQYCAKQLSLTPNYFGDIIKRLSGKSAKEHIQQVTIEYAKLYLADNKYTISQVAYKTGFKYPHHLSRVFKKITGLSPFDYRREVRRSRAAKD